MVTMFLREGRMKQYFGLVGFTLVCMFLFMVEDVYSFQITSSSLNGRNTNIINNLKRRRVVSLQQASSLLNDEGCYVYDLAVIGGGPVGVKAALIAAAAPFNKRVCMIDAPRASGMLYDEQAKKDLSIGGPTGLFSKALRDTSKRIKVDSLRGMGLREESIWNEIISSCVDLATLNADDVMRQLEEAGVDYIEGMASFPDAGGTETLYITNPDHTQSCVAAGKILIATGSQPFRPAGIPFDGKRIFDSDSINTLSYVPKSVAITGSGIIAIGTFLQIYKTTTNSFFFFFKYDSYYIFFLFLFHYNYYSKFKKKKRVCENISKFRSRSVPYHS